MCRSVARTWSEGEPNERFKGKSLISCASCSGGWSAYRDAKPKCEDEVEEQGVGKHGGFHMSGRPAEQLTSIRSKLLQSRGIQYATSKCSVRK